MDDASPPEYDEVLRAATGLGERIRLVKLAVNAGTYAARNAGLDAAGGEFAAFQDSDDWSHPRRLELQVRAAARGPAAGRHHLGRAGRHRPADAQPAGGAQRPVQPVVAADPPRHGAARRSATSTGCARPRTASTSAGSRPRSGARRVRHLESLPLALIRLSANSLSRSEIKPHWMHPARTAYSSAYLRRHQLIAAGAAPAYRPADGTDRPFPAPGHLLGADPDRVAAYDVVMVADWRFLESPQRTAVDEMRALAAAGLRVAVLHLESYRAVYLKPAADLRAGAGPDQRGRAGPGRAARAGRGRAGAGPAGRGAAVRRRRRRAGSGRGRVVRGGRSGAGARRRHGPAVLPETCSAAARRLFEADPEWVPQDSGVRASLRTGLAEPDFPTAVAVAGWVAQRTAAAPGPAIVGTDLCDAANWPPDIADTLAVLRRLPEADVRVRLPTGRAPSPRSPCPGTGSVTRRPTSPLARSSTRSTSTCTSRRRRAPSGMPGRRWRRRRWAAWW